MLPFRNLALCRCGLALLAATFIAGCATPAEATKQTYKNHTPKDTASRQTKSAKGYTVRGVTYYPLKSAHGYREEGYAVWYGGKGHHGKPTSSEKRYNQHAMTAAHKTLPLGSVVRVTCLQTGKSVVVRINDRGPFVKGYVIDLSYAAAKQIGLLRHHRTRVRVEALK